ncbi:acetamidase/formamidase family protein [Candidatus Bathyarchaeota archaeon]|nr:acetamidase/formamidase family protein [Candidatus Bathyarchaeota archaeon]MBS7631609.1 acetamidase/formamidase family protein [Candidatus Bathyarchaeota archaeon]
MEHKFKPKIFYFTYGTNEPAYRIKPGDIVVSETVDAGGFDSKGEPIPEEMKQKIGGTVLSPSNPLIGPFYVEGAEAGDALSIKIERIRLSRETAWSRHPPNFGCLTEEGPDRRLLLNEPIPLKAFHWRLDISRNLGILELPNSRTKRVEIPLHPFIGSIGVAPRFGRVETALTPGEYGGNMDCIETREGATLFLPVFSKGGYLSLGDIHAAQGDGEICGVALETTAEVKLRINVVKGAGITWPRIEDDEYIMAVGNSRPLMEAFKIAHVELLNWLVSEYEFEEWEGFQLMSQVGRCRVGNVVDPKYTVVAKFPKRYLPKP